jgi:hypothetical protein
MDDQDREKRIADVSAKLAHAREQKKIWDETPLPGDLETRTNVLYKRDHWAKTVAELKQELDELLGG